MNQEVQRDIPASGTRESDRYSNNQTSQQLLLELYGLELKSKSSTLNNPEKSDLAKDENAFNQDIRRAYTAGGINGVDRTLKSLSTDHLQLSLSSHGYTKQEKNPKFDDINFAVSLTEDGKDPVELDTKFDAYWKTPLKDRPLPPGLPDSDKANFNNDLPSFDIVNLPNMPGLKLYRGGAPSQQGLKDLKDLHVDTIIDFRQPSEKGVEAEKDFANANGIKYINIPEVSNLGPGAQNLKDYFQAIDKGGTIYEHCEHGRDRTGVMQGFLDLRQNGGDSSKALADMREHGISDSESNAYPNYPRLDQMIESVNGARSVEEEIAKLGEWLEKHPALTSQ